MAGRALTARQQEGLRADRDETGTAITGRGDVSEFRIGSIDGGTNVIGDHATMNNYGVPAANLAHVSSLIDSLVQLAARSGAQTPDQETVNRAAEEARTEMTREYPRPRVLCRLIDRIVAAAGSTATVIQAADEIRKAVSQLI